MLMMANYEWFADFKAADSKGRPIRSSERKEGYERLKNMWKDKCMKIFLKYFPKAEGHFESIDISTPLTIENYLNTPFGGAVGIDVTPARFVDPDVRRALDVVTNIPGLYLTGQDTVLCGVTLAQVCDWYFFFHYFFFFFSLDYCAMYSCLESSLLSVWKVFVPPSRSCCSRSFWEIIR